MHMIDINDARKTGRRFFEKTLRARCQLMLKRPRLAIAGKPRRKSMRKAPLLKPWGSSLTRVRDRNVYLVQPGTVGWNESYERKE